MVAIRDMTHADLPAVFDLHCRQFPEGLHVRLGHAFALTYLRSCVPSPHAIALVALCGLTPIGYLIGMTAPARHRAFALRYCRLRLLWWGGVGALRSPLLVLRALRPRLRRMVRQVYRRGGVSSPARMPATSGAPPGLPDAPDAPDAPEAVLAYVAVEPGARAGGVGSALVDEFLRRARDAGCSRAALVTLAGEDGAGPFYERRGWNRTGSTRTPQGRELLLYRFPLGGTRDGVT